jgi:organic radical activating enzyme
MKAPIVEIFSSIQGEGLLIGRRQIFIRFAGCNLSCNYCDTPKSQNANFGKLLSVENVLKEISNLITPDLHSISFTGGEPLLYVDFINEILDKINIKSLLETNGTLPNELSRLRNINCISLDIKLPEHFNKKWDKRTFENELGSLKLLIEKETNVYCKIVVLPSTKLSLIKEVIKSISKITPENSNIPLVIQPSNPIEEWKPYINDLFKILEIGGQYMDVLLIPQIHKILNIE